MAKSITDPRFNEKDGKSMVKEVGKTSLNDTDAARSFIKSARDSIAEGKVADKLEGRAQGMARVGEGLAKFAKLTK